MQNSPFELTETVRGLLVRMGERQILRCYKLIFERRVELRALLLFCMIGQEQQRNCPTYSEIMTSGVAHN